jgi:DNA-binding transcriptional MerR regulator/effector-binding domain-containing protein
MDVRISIGDFARMTHLSVKALRHYHELGLLEPDAVDPSSGYRFYTAEQVPSAQVIRRLRDLEMPLDEVRSVLDAPDVPTRNAAIVVHLGRMEEQLANTRETVTGLRTLLEAPPLRLPVEFRSIPAATTLAVSDVVTVAEFGSWWGAAFAELFDAVRRSGLEVTAPPGALYPGELFEQEVGRMTAFVPVADAPDQPGRVRPVTVPAVEAAVAVHAGSMGELDQTYAALGTEVAERGVIGVEGPIREYYLVSVFDTDDEARHRTEVAWPVFRTSARTAET